MLILKSVSCLCCCLAFWMDIGFCMQESEHSSRAILGETHGALNFEGRLAKPPGQSKMKQHPFLGPSGYDTVGKRWPPNAPLNVPLEAPFNAPLNGPLDAPLDAPLNAPLNAPLRVPLNAPLNAPLKVRPLIFYCFRY